MNDIKISIVTPSYNQGAYIEETILSVIKQEYPFVEYMIIDGGSSDNSIEIIKKYENHLTYWVSEKDKGQSDAINKGFKKATGDIVCWLNSDDILLPDTLNKVAKYFKNNSNVDLLNGHLLRIDESSKIIRSHFMIKQKDWYAKQGIYYITQPSMFWRSKVLKEVGTLREDFHAAMDREFLIRVFKNGSRIGHLNKILAGFRMHGASKSSAGWGNPNYLRDLEEIKAIYGSTYGRSPNPYYQAIYRLEKFIKGVYFQNILFNIKWKNKNASSLTTKNCKYLS